MIVDFTCPYAGTKHAKNSQSWNENNPEVTEAQQR